MGRPETSAALAAIIAAVPGMGQVHSRDRYSASWSTFLANFKDGDKINGCMITRKATVKRMRVIGITEYAHIFTVRMIYGLQDAADSAEVFQLLVDAVMAAVDANETLSGTCDTTSPDWGPMEGAIGLHLDTIDNRQFGTVLCHYAEARICAVLGL